MGNSRYTVGVVEVTQDMESVVGPKNFYAIDLEDLGKYHRKQQLRVVCLCLNLMQFVERDCLLTLADYVDGLSGSDRQALLEDVLSYNEKHNPYSNQRYYQLIKQALIEQVGKPMEYFKLHALWLSEEAVHLALDDMVDVYPTDRVCLTSDVLDELKKFWHGADDSDMDYFMPSDIFFAKQVSILDMEIFLTKCVDGKDVVYESRVCIYENYMDEIDGLNECDDESAAPMGYLDIRIPGVDNMGFAVQFGVIPGIDVLVFDERCAPYGFLDEDLKQDFFRGMDTAQLVKLCTKHLQTWYTIQMALLHPVVSQLFDHGYVIKDKRRRFLGKKTVKMNRKLKVNDVTMEHIQEIREKNPVIRKTMAWYVMGHWRNYKSGKSTFISPYWKGPLKDMKSVSGTRVRVIDNNSVEALRKDDEHGEEEKVNEKADN